MDEKLAITKIKDGDREAFTFLYKRYWPKVYNFTNLYILSPDAAEEVVQDVFIKLWENRADLDEEKNFDGYLFIITRNLIFNRSRQDFNRMLYQTTLFEAIEEPTSVEEELETADLRRHINALISLLPPRQQEVFRLSREEHLTYHEIAQKLQISEKTVERHMGEALKFLRKNLQMFVCFLTI